MFLQKRSHQLRSYWRMIQTICITFSHNHSVRNGFLWKEDRHLSKLYHWTTWCIQRKKKKSEREAIQLDMKNGVPFIKMHSCPNQTMGRIRFTMPNKKRGLFHVFNWVCIYKYKGVNVGCKYVDVVIRESARLWSIMSVLFRQGGGLYGRCCLLWF